MHLVASSVIKLALNSYLTFRAISIDNLSGFTIYVQILVQVTLKTLSFKTIICKLVDMCIWGEYTNTNIFIYHI